MALRDQLAAIKKADQRIAQPSLLFNKEVAGEQDIDSIFHLGNKAIVKLMQIDPQFINYQELFSTQKKGIKRQLLSKNENTLLDNQIRKVLLLLSQYFSCISAQQALEYLLRNYSIHQYNADQLIIYFMQFHSTGVYTRLLQNIVDNHKEGMWAFLYEPISKAQPLKREMILRAIHFDYRILKFILEYAIELLEPLEKPAEMVISVDLLSEEEIKNIQSRKPNNLAFVFALLFEINDVNQVRGLIGKLLACCFRQQETLGFVYLLFQQQLFNSSRTWLTEDQIANTAAYVYKQPQIYLDLCVLFYQFGIGCSAEHSLSILNCDLKKYYSNSLLLVELMRPLRKMTLKGRIMNSLMLFLKNILSKGFSFMDCLIENIHPQLIEVLKPYLKGTEFAQLFPDAYQCRLTEFNAQEILQRKDQLKVMSVGALSQLVDEGIQLYQRFKKEEFLQIIEIILEQNIYPEATLIEQWKLYQLFVHKGNYLRLIKLLKLDTILTILLYAIHNFETINKLLEIYDLEPISNEHELYTQIHNGDAAYLPNFIKQSYPQLIFKQAQIKVGVFLNESLVDLIDAYPNNDEFIQGILNSIPIEHLLKINNPISVRNIKQRNLDYNIFWNVDEQSQIKILLYFLAKDIPSAFLQELFLCYDLLTVDQKDLFFQILQKNKLMKFMIGKTDFTPLVLSFLKSKKEGSSCKSLSVLNETQLFEMQLQYMKLNTRIIARQLKTISLIAKDIPRQILQFIEYKFKPEYTESYLHLSQNHKFIESLPLEEYGLVLNKIDILNYPKNLLTRVVRIIFSTPMKDRQLQILDVNYQQLTDLFQTKSFEMATAVSELFKLNYTYIDKSIVDEIFTIPLIHVTPFTDFVYHYIDQTQNLFLAQSSTLLSKYRHLDLNDYNNYTTISSIVKLIAKHTQYKKLNVAYKSLNCTPDLQFIKIVASNFQNHNKIFFKNYVSPILLAQTLTLTDNIQNFSHFSEDILWILLMLISSSNIESNLKQSLYKMDPSVLLSWTACLSESLYHRSVKNRTALKIKCKHIAYHTPNLEQSIKRSIGEIRQLAPLFKLKQSFASVLKTIDEILEHIKKYLLSQKLSDHERQQVKVSIETLDKFQGLFSESKLGTLSGTIKNKLISLTSSETMLHLLQSGSRLLFSAFAEMLANDTIKLTKAQQPQVLELISSLEEFYPETLIALNHIFQINSIAKQDHSALINKLMLIENPQEKALTLNLLSLSALQQNYPYIEILNPALEQLITLLPTQPLLKETLKNFIKAFKALISKSHLEQIILNSLEDQNIQQCILENIEKRLLLDLFSKITSADQSIPLINFLALMIKSSEQETIQLQYMVLTKSVLNLFDQFREKYIDSEMENGIFTADSHESAAIEIVVEIVLKVSDTQLKKIYNALIIWSKAIQSGYNFTKYRKITFFKISNQLSNRLQSHFTKYHVYIFDALINELNTFHQQFYETPKETRLQKRTQDECDMYYKLELLLQRHIQTCVEYLCISDQEQFIDTQRFEALVAPLAQTLDCARVQQFEPLLPFIEEWITPAILSLFHLLNDDYKWKTLHSQILLVIGRHTQKKNQTSALICIGTIKLIQKLLDQLDDRYLVLMNDLIPYLHTLTTSSLNNPELEMRVKQLIIKLSQISGQDIQAYLK